MENIHPLFLSTVSKSLHKILLETLDGGKMQDILYGGGRGRNGPKWNIFGLLGRL